MGLLFQSEEKEYGIGDIYPNIINLENKINL